ncbi:MAG: ATP synthase F1 subunit delta [Bdellovibrionaceae bacterium]|nr:ATP synthase F1 subunit delta [Pseudobdellovibrionaceae bacterium]
MSKDFVYQYAKALFDLGENLDIKTKYLKELRVLSEVLSSSDVENFLLSRQVSLADKIKILDKTLEQIKASKDVVNTLKMLTERNKITYLPEITSSYESLNDEANGVVRGTVKSSYILSPAQRSAIESKIQGVLNKKVILTYVEDKKVIGGIKAQVGSYTFDDTFETHLKKLKDQINRSAN